MKKVIILRMLIVLMVTLITGCAVKETYLFNQPIHPSGLNSGQKQKMQAREIERQKAEAEEYLRRQERGEHSSMSVPVLTSRF